eukprot:3800994-Lingulodinium_polyedra.AAC.1
MVLQSGPAWAPNTRRCEAQLTNHAQIAGSKRSSVAEIHGSMLTTAQKQPSKAKRPRPASP